MRFTWPGAWTALFIVLLPSCRAGDAIPRSLEARLKSSAAATPADLSADQVEQALARQLRVAPLPAGGGATASNPAFPTRQTLTEFYDRHAHRLVWCDDSGERLARSNELLGALRVAGEHGLDPEDYALTRLDALAAEVGQGPLDPSAVVRLADFDLLMTAAFFRYASDLSTGRLHPDEIQAGWSTAPAEIDFVAALDRAVDGDDLSKLLEALPPPHAGYAHLRSAMKELRVAAAAGEWPMIPEGGKLQIGARDPRVVLLRRRLSETKEDDAGGELYDRDLAASVSRFQEQHGIKPDGKVGVVTLAELNVPIDARIREIELNLERWRWIPRQLGDPHVLVNIPGFELELVRNEAPVWRTRIVVGSAYTPTPVFSDRIVAIVANPPWNVPESIALKEYLPELRKNSKALTRHGLRLVTGSGKDTKDVRPSKIDWEGVDRGEFAYRLRQDPGPDSALGRLKFDLTNENNIYLHDTPSRQLFDQAGRDLSHGCIRVEKPLELAVQLLGETSQVQLHEALAQREERHLALKPPVPVHILYFTSWVDEAGILRFAPDVYELDGPQIATMDRVATPR